MPSDARRRAGLWLAIAGAHVGALWALQHLGVWKDRRAVVERPALQVVLLPLPASADPAGRTPAAAPAVAPLRQPASRPRTAAPEGFIAPLPAVTVQPPVPPSPPPSPVPPPPAPPLVLDLPRAASAVRRSPALDDARANTARATVESRIAATLDDRLIEERRGDGTVRFRRGNECVDVLPNRDAQLDPFNESFAKKPGTAQGC